MGMAHELRQSLTRIEAAQRQSARVQAHHTELLEALMQGEDDLRQAIADNAAAMHDAADQLLADADALAKAATGQDPDADIGALANQLKANTAQFKLALANAKNPAPAPVENTGGAANAGPAPAPVDTGENQGAAAS